MSYVPPPAPELEIQAVLRTQWQDGATAYGDAPEIKTGEYRRGDTPVPVIAISGGEEGPISGPETGYSAIDGAGGGGMQRMNGGLSLDCVAGTYDDLAGAGPNGEDLNPKQVRWQLYSHAAQLVVDNQEATALKNVSPGEATRIRESHGEGDEVSMEFRIRFRVMYNYDRRPTQ